MPFLKKHGRLIQILLIMSVPILVSFCSGFWLSYLFKESQHKGEDEIRYRKLVVESQMLSDQLYQNLESLKFQAQWMGELKNPGQVFLQTGARRSGVKAWSEFEVKAGLEGVKVRRFLKGASSSVGFDSQYLSKIVKEVTQNSSQVLSNLDHYGFHLLDSSYSEGVKEGGGYAFLFQSPTSKNLIHFVLVDPEVFFSPFQSWVKHSQGGLSQSALLVLGKGVMVQSHPSQSYWKKLSEEPFFRYQSQNVLKKVAIQARGDFKLDSNVWVRASLIGFKNLPWAIAVSELKLSSTSGFHSSGMVWLYAVFVGLLILASLVIASSHLARHLTQVVPLTLVKPVEESQSIQLAKSQQITKLEEDSAFWMEGMNPLRLHHPSQSELDH